jgi:2-oxoglutarate dehydrogenase complex dehydrogenase (E1) component-like enzyme
MNFMSEKQAQLEALDSLLSEAAVLGFEYGYSTADPLSACNVGSTVRRFC